MNAPWPFTPESARMGLLTGDMGPSALRQLFRAGGPQSATLFKLPHQGSRHSHPAPFLDACRPEATFVSAGRHNVYGLPHPEVVEYCATAGISLSRTDRHETLLFRTNGHGWQAARLGKGLFR